MADMMLRENKVLPEHSAAAIEQLSSILSAYNETTNKLSESYRQLKGEVNRLRRELKRKNEQLERKSRLAALGEMAAGMAHEIRNPLGGVQLYASLLERELAGQERALGWVRKISKGVNTLDTIVNDMLAFTQDQTCEKTRTNLWALLAEVLDYVGPQVKDRPVTVNVDKVDREVAAAVDVNMMRRILMNLVLNAIEAVGEEGTVTITMESYRGSAGYAVRICVEDTGPGIPEAVRSKIFDPFFTTKDTGTGLGLAIVHRLVECHGGVITAGNKRKGGAIFTILLP